MDVFSSVWYHPLLCVYVLLQLDYITAQQKSDMLNAQSDKRDILREKEQLKLELEEELAQQVL